MQNKSQNQPVLASSHWKVVVQEKASSHESQEHCGAGQAGRTELRIAVAAEARKSIRKPISVLRWI
jgi:hypothetical protein